MYLNNRHIPNVSGESDHVEIQTLLTPDPDHCDPRSRFLRERLRYLEIPVVGVAGRHVYDHLMSSLPESSGVSHHYCAFHGVL
jgi:hypothetical protein